jgi:hypothetical protein
VDTGDVPTPDALHPAVIRCLVLLTGTVSVDTSDLPLDTDSSVLTAGGRPMAARCLVLTTGDVPTGIIHQPGFSPYKYTLLKYGIFAIFLAFLIFH